MGHLLNICKGAKNLFQVISNLRTMISSLKFFKLIYDLQIMMMDSLKAGCSMETFLPFFIFLFLTDQSVRSNVIFHFCFFRSNWLINKSKRQKPISIVNQA